MNFKNHCHQEICEFSKIAFKPQLWGGSHLKCRWCKNDKCLQDDKGSISWQQMEETFPLTPLAKGYTSILLVGIRKGWKVLPGAGQFVTCFLQTAAHIEMAMNMDRQKQICRFSDTSNLSRRTTVTWSYSFVHQTSKNTYLQRYRL